ncbi:MAG: AAA family ATPase [Bacteroidia bacterium]|nr:AAA family ATPase [Bacteroidia bacterium]
MKEIFNGNKKLFRELWIYDKIDWEKYPVIKIDFSEIDYEKQPLYEAIIDEILIISKQNNIKLTNNTLKKNFRELIQKLSGKNKVVILIDEYDKPIIDYIDNIRKAEENRKILKNFYSVLKPADRFLKFVFITGVSKFSQVSLFSDLNNLNDITLNRKYNNMLGYTQEELEKYFPEYIKLLAEHYKDIYPDIKREIKEHYNGYSWDGKNFVYNPFSILGLFENIQFGDYWFRTGTPTFLTKLIKTKNYTAFDLEKKKVYGSDLDKYEIKNITLLPLLFQTGYLTIKEADLSDDTYLLDYPNKEVAKSFSVHLLNELNGGRAGQASSLLIDMIQAVREQRIEKFIDLINALFKGIPYTIAEEKEKYFHSIFYIIVRLLGFTIESEILTIDGRIDSVVFTDNFIYIIELKAQQSSKKAIKQIKDKEYCMKYADDKRKKILLGINFNTKTKKIDDYVYE